MNFAKCSFSAALLVLIGVALFSSTNETAWEFVVIGLVGLLFAGLISIGKASLHPTRGAVTVTYQYPVAGTVAPTPTTPPYNTVRGTVIATANGDTTAVITHNFGLSAGALALGQPEVSLVALTAAYWASQWTAAYTDGNNVTLTKINSAGGAGPAQLGFFLKRPHSIAI